MAHARPFPNFGTRLPRLRRAAGVRQLSLADSDWWSVQSPAPRLFTTSEGSHGATRISAGGILWKRLCLADDTPVRLLTKV